MSALRTRANLSQQSAFKSCREAAAWPTARGILGAFAPFPISKQPLASSLAPLSRCQAGQCECREKTVSPAPGPRGSPGLSTPASWKCGVRRGATRAGSGCGKPREEMGKSESTGGGGTGRGGRGSWATDRREGAPGFRLTALYLGHQ